MKLLILIGGIVVIALIIAGFLWIIDNIRLGGPGYTSKNIHKDREND